MKNLASTVCVKTVCKTHAGSVKQKKTECTKQVARVKRPPTTKSVGAKRHRICVTDETKGADCYMLPIRSKDRQATDDGDRAIPKK